MIDLNALEREYRDTFGKPMSFDALTLWQFFFKSELTIRSNGYAVSIFGTIDGMVYSYSVHDATIPPELLVLQELTYIYAQECLRKRQEHGKSTYWTQRADEVNHLNNLSRND